MCVRSLGYILGASPPVKICVSIRWVTLWVRPPLCEYMCVRSLGYIVGASPLVCVLSLVDNLRWILACCLLHFAAFWTICMSVWLCVCVRVMTRFISKIEIDIGKTGDETLSVVVCVCVHTSECVCVCVSVCRVSNCWGWGFSGHRTVVPLCVFACVPVSILNKLLYGTV